MSLTKRHQRETPLLPLIFILLGIWSLPCEAGLFKITNRNYGSAGAYAQYIDPIFNALENEVNSFLPLADHSIFLKSMANAAAISGTANAANYGSSIEIFQVGAQAGIATGDTNTPPSGGSFALNSVSGFGGQASILLGFNLGIFAKKFADIDLKRTWGYLGFFTYTYSKDNTSIKSTAATLYGQYRMVEPTSHWLGTVRWNGVMVGTGLRYAALSASFTEIVSETTSDAVSEIPGNPTITTTYTGTINAGANIGVVSIPCDISTSVRLLYIFTPYIGMGTDINGGIAKSIANISGPVTVTESTATYGSMSGTATLDLGDTGRPTFLDIRTFIGAQLELGVLALNLTFTREWVTRTSGIALGLKAYY